MLLFMIKHLNFIKHLRVTTLALNNIIKHQDAPTLFEVTNKWILTLFLFIRIGKSFSRALVKPIVEVCKNAFTNH